VAERTGATFVPFSAVLGGVKEIREIVAAARERKRLHRQRTILFVDEIHRFSRSQQDAFLPHVEAGTVTLVGATTENPSFEINKALLSRTRVLVLNPLSESEMSRIVERALDDPDRGLGRPAVRLDPEAMALLCRSAQGDARRALNTLEVAAFIRRERGSADLLLGGEDIREALQKKSLAYDKSGEEHFNLVSAFIKSMRGSDPDAAVYWMVRMLEAGEDPLFLVRRMVIFASEDIGNADPQALAVAVAAKEAVHFVGLPEAVLNLSQAATYLACAPKSNASCLAYAAARRAVLEHGALPAPLHLRNAPTSLMRELGYGKDYRYPHDAPGGVVPEEQYLPAELAGSVFYEPVERGGESGIRERLHRWRAMRAAARKNK